MRISLHTIIIFLTGLACFLLIESQYFLGVINTPKDFIYLGTVHYPPDYLTYLGFMMQGEEYWLNSKVLYTSEKIPINMVRWQFVFFGRVLMSLGFNVIQSYQMFVGIFLIGFLVAGYLVVRNVFPDSLGKQKLAYLFFALSTSWPIIKSESGKIVFDYHNYWFNTGNILGRFGPTPHHLMASLFFLVSLLLTVFWFKQLINPPLRIRRLASLAGLFISSAILAGTTPVQWMLVVSATLFSAVIWSVKRITKKSKTSIGTVLKYLLPFSLSFLGGLPVTLYFISANKVVPYNYGIEWEAWQQIHMNLMRLFEGSGLIVVFAAIGIIAALRKINIWRSIYLPLLLVCLIFYFGSWAYQFRLTNVRFWPPAIYVFLGILSAEGVFFLSSVLKIKKNFILVCLVILFILTIIPSHIALVNQFPKMRADMRYYYVWEDEYSLFQFAKKESNKKSIFLMEWPYNELFPAFSGRTSFYGNHLSYNTINLPSKMSLVNRFFRGEMSKDEVDRFLTIHNIDFVLAYRANMGVLKYPGLSEIKSTRDLILYKTLVK